MILNILNRDVFENTKVLPSLLIIPPDDLRNQTCFPKNDKSLGIPAAKSISTGRNHLLIHTNDNLIYGIGNNWYEQICENIPLKTKHSEEYKGENSDCYSEQREYKGRVRFVKWMPLPDAEKCLNLRTEKNNSKSENRTASEDKTQVHTLVKEKEIIPVQKSVMQAFHSEAHRDTTYLIDIDRETLYVCGRISWYSNITSERRFKFPVPIVEVACGEEHVMAVDPRGKVYGWGQNENGRIGKKKKIGEFLSNITEIQEHGVVSKVIANYKLTVVFKQTNKELIFSHSLGGGDDGNLHRKRRKLRSAGYIAKACCGEKHIILLLDDGSTYTWGSNQYGQLGLTCVTDPFSDRDAPSLVNSCLSNLYHENIISISAGKRHSLFLTKEGDVYASGMVNPIAKGEKKVSVRPTRVFGGENEAATVKGNILKAIEIYAGEDYSVLSLAPKVEKYPVFT